MKLKGKVTIRQAKDLAEDMRAALARGDAPSIDASAVEEIDSAILQLLCSLRRTAAGMAIVNPSPGFVASVARCGLGHVLLNNEMKAAKGNA